MLAGKAVTKATTPVAGCFISRAADGQGREGRGHLCQGHVARIVQNRCQECHRPGQIGPMPLLTYEDASSWSQMIREVVSDERMPPWHADPKHGKFKNDRRLSDEERSKLLAWIDAGLPRRRRQGLPRPEEVHGRLDHRQAGRGLHDAESFTVPAKAPREASRISIS